MFDENGIWQDQIYPTAGPSGGATGALDLMNVMQSGQNYNQEHAAKMAFLLSKILSDRNAQALAQNPYAAQAVEMKPEDLQAAYGQTPEGQFQSYALNNPNATMDDYLRQQVRFRLTPPTQVASFARASMTDQAKMERLEKVIEQKNGHDAMITFRSQLAAGVPIQDALDQALAAPTGILPGPNVPTPKASADIAAKAAQTNFINEGKLPLAQAQTQFILTKDNWYPAIASAQTQNLLSSAGHNDALTASNELHTAITSQEAEGAMTPQQRVDMQRKVAQNTDALRRMQADQSIQDEIKKGSPAGQVYQQAMQALQLGIRQGNKLAQTAPSIKLAKPAPAAAAPTASEATAHPTFKSMQEFTAAFRKDQGRDPTASEIVRAQAAHWF